MDFVDRQPHRDAHEERLRQFETGVVVVDEVTVVQGLQTEIGKLVVAFGFERLAEFFEVELEQFSVEQFELGGLFQVVTKIIRIAIGHFAIGRAVCAIVNKGE